MVRPSPHRLWVSSNDNAWITVMRTGAGRALVVCPRSAHHLDDWQPFANLVAPYVTVYLVQRRRHRDIDAEIHDLLAVLDVAGDEAVLLGHSDAGSIALKVARRRRLAGLVLYEPSPTSLPSTAAPVPTLVVVGELSPPPVTATARHLRQALPDARLVVLGGQASNAHLDDRYAVAYAVLPFVTATGSITEASA